MSRLVIPCALLALLSAPILTSAEEVKQTVSLAALKGANPADCAEANSDYERYELGCPISEVAGGPVASNSLPAE